MRTGSKKRGEIKDKRDKRMRGNNREIKTAIKTKIRNDQEEEKKGQKNG